MKHFKIFVLMLSAITLLSIVNVYGNETINIVPVPVSVTANSGNFSLSARTQIFCNFQGKDADNITGALLTHIKKFYGIEGLKLAFSEKPVKNSIFLSINSKANIKKEGYKLTVEKNHVLLEASAPNGLFYGIQSLVQMMPAVEERISEIKIQAAVITDYPRFEWRGLHLDVCRHFMPKAFVLKYIDYMSMHKFNTLHFHLTEDQGWRIEIKKYPRLTTVGSMRKETIVGRGNTPVQLYDGIPHGGYYTQEDIKEIVEYAAKRYVTVVPEIEMPGHALAALAAYPELGCTGGPYEVATKWGVFKDVMCAGKENTYNFLQDVIDEVLALFPSQYIHIGGDECPKDSWKVCPLCQQKITDLGLKNEHELQSYLIQRMEKYINNKGRKIIGWDEILEGGLAPNAAVMSWRGEAGGIEAAKQHHYVVMTPGSHCYLDHYQADPASQPQAIGGFTTLEKIYNYEPVPSVLSAEEAKYIMGAQGNVWTEWMPVPSHVEYMVYPRAAALAEVVWSPKEGRDYAGFKERMRSQILRYNAYGINYCRIEFQ